MGLIRVIVFTASLAVALSPLVAFAEDTSPTHMQDELANSEEQFVLAQQEAQDLDAQAQLSAANERMIAQLKSEAMRLRQLNLVSNATAMEQIAAALANAARADGDLNARNELAIAQLKAANLIAIADANLANGAMLARTKGRVDEFLNAQAQSNLLHELANFISGRQAELNMANAKEIGQEQADAIHTPKLVEEQNGVAMGANDLLAGDLALAAGQLNATSVVISEGAKSSTVVGHALSSLANARTRAGVSGSMVVAADSEGALVADDEATIDIIGDDAATDAVGADEETAE